MNGLDAVLALAAATAAVGGFRLGFVTRVASWAGMVVGIVGGALLLPTVIDRVDGRFERSELVLLAAAVVIGAGLVGQAVGLVAGSRLHLAIPQGRFRRADAGVGAVAGVVGVVVSAWLVLPAVADVPGWPSRQVRGSVSVEAIDRWLPDAPDASRSVRRLLGDRYPRVFDALRPTPELGPPPAASGLSPETAERVRASTVLVSGPACDRIQEGSGFVVAPGIVATNAHVVAGDDATEVETADGERLAGRVVAFDPKRDLALVEVPGLDRPVLPLADAEVGDRGAVFGHPGGGPLRLAPFEVGEVVAARGTDIYDRDTVDRQVLVLAADLAPGDSGSALVSPAGDVVGVAFAIAPDRPGVAYALTTAELRTILDRVRTETVGVGICIG